ncbi:hypothetical protein BDW02DRAFT_652036 [Decorospora gaudefroyi]|uniref:Ecp2 effector protein domain-containing protein n=1 Tax=Decorospora gaudefroyi TaxID=184978 RepID=A0A6A5K2P0_9PLEO|nr:hypothetical protein BDW02DRAFT_652036 [Decorospora gaudefroyi]
MHFQKGLALSVLIATSPVLADWGSHDHAIATYSCSIQCGSLMPIFHRDEVIDWLRQIHEYPCDKHESLYGDGSLGYTTWAPNPDVDCTIVGPRTPEGGYERWKAAMADPSFHWGAPGGTRAGRVTIYSPSGIQLGNLAWSGACLGIGPGGPVGGSCV